MMKVMGIDLLLSIVELDKYGQNIRCTHISEKKLITGQEIGVYYNAANDSITTDSEM